MEDLGWMVFGGEQLNLVDSSLWWVMNGCVSFFLGPNKNLSRKLHKLVSSRCINMISSDSERRYAGLAEYIKSACLIGMESAHPNTEVTVTCCHDLCASTISI